MEFIVCEFLFLCLKSSMQSFMGQAYFNCFLVLQAIMALIQKFLAFATCQSLDVNAILTALSKRKPEIWHDLHSDCCRLFSRLVPFQRVCWY